MTLKENDYAPVFIPTLCRFEHFKRCVDSLARCTGAKNTTLIIGLDYPLKDCHWDGYRKIKEYIPTIEGLKDIIVLERPVNYGALKNGEDAFKYIYERYDRMILSEDDNEFSPNFLEFVNKGLVKYRDDSRVIAICGYVYPHDYMINSNVFWGLGYSAWGVGLWKDKHIKIRETFNNHGIDYILNSWRKTIAVFRISPKIVNSMITMRTRNLIWGDVLLNADCILNKKGSIFPVLAKVRNWGDDGSGMHCKKADETSNQIIDERDLFNEDFDVDFSNQEKFAYRRKASVYLKIIILIRYIIYRFIRKDILSQHYEKAK